ncbi:MAG: tyrosine-type recombinase/integrase [Gemmataceae bacterium]
MARLPSPWYWDDRDGWYVTIDGRRHFLGDQPHDAPPPKKVRGKWNAPDAVRQRFHALLAAPAAGPGAPAHAPADLTVSEVFDAYLDWCQRHREPRTYAGYVWHLQRFVTHLQDRATMPALALRPFHVVGWLDAHPGWGPTYRRNSTAAVQRAYNWAEELGHLASNPVRKIAKPAPARREHLITPADWAAIRDSYRPGDPFREFLEFCWLTGCRPFEARTLVPRHVRLDKALIAIPPAEAKGRKKWRLIRLEGQALEIVRARLPGATTTLFVNRDGAAWTSSAINCRFGRLKGKLGVRHFAYALRHAFATRLLVDGVDHLTVAELLGHADGTTLAKTYQHLDQADDHLRRVLRAAGGA